MSAPEPDAVATAPLARLLEHLRPRGGRGAARALTRDEDLAGRKNLVLLIQLRWFAVAGQIVSILVVAYGFGASLPLLPMGLVIAALVTLNLVSLLRLYSRTHVTNGELFTALVFDVAALTVQLYLSGGAQNPFTALFLLQVTLGAVLLEAWSIGCLVGLAIVSFAGLTRFHRPLDLLDVAGTGVLAPQTMGLLVCFVINSVLLVVFVTRINRNARERDARFAHLRQTAAEEDHIVRMGLLASGAAHELGTPLSTLSIILGDWRRMPALTADPELSGEIDAMRAEVARCKSIVTGVLLAAGEARGESAGATTLFRFLDGLAADWRATRPGVNFVYANEVDEDWAIVAESTLRQGVFNVLDNAVEASPGWLCFTAHRDGETLVLRVVDEGPGFPPEILAQIGRPYQSTKDRRAGGLGLFLVFNVVRKLGGHVSVRNRESGGAEVELRLPLATLAIEDEDVEDEDGEDDDERA
ncbi:ATP-binding protein [Aureimonas pseudogalii]|uniref:histidine kinase n=1 Tax=Aureimonas pseudogalii TaxID=1744844 RepID=A0A7W6EDS6_9HYPH|nr:ATP-binding protein [Aureimonas pseudogalii]MBB3996810.1 two-component system sensor histidine kinase RegB [Aureimonas pseudogalii]